MVWASRRILSIQIKKKKSEILAKWSMAQDKGSDSNPIYF